MASILLVEDDELVAGLFAKVLRQAGHELLTAYSGDQALEMCKQAAGNLSMVITDVVLPGMPGPEWVAMAGAELEGVPVVYITGYSREAREEQGFDVDESHLLVKPVDIDALLDAVDRHLS
ncbi:MAG: response regulator [Armatimonadia bacterium]|nr:response regulator [Armatimonadia bacterium]